MTEIIQNTDVDFSEAVRSIGTLVACRTHKWGASKKDAKAARQVAQANNIMRDDATSVTKHLLVGADAEYKELIEAINACYRCHIGMTVEWASDKSGNRLLANRRTFEYATAMGPLRDTVAAKKKAFGVVYATRLQEALANLSGLANPADYPTEQEILSKFGVEIIFSPVPSGQDFGYLDEAFANHFAKDLNNRVTQWVDNAMQDGWKRLEVAISKMKDTLADEEQMKFKSSLVDNVKQLVGLVKDFNITNRPEYAELVEEVEQKLCVYTAPQLKNSIGTRRTVASEASSVLDKLASYGLAGTQQAA